MPELPPEGSKADFFFIERNNPEEIAATLILVEASDVVASTTFA